MGKSVNSLMYQNSGALVTFYDDIKFLTSNGQNSCRNVPSYIKATAFSRKTASFFNTYNKQLLLLDAK